jgi:hypothetical protein
VRARAKGFTTFEASTDFWRFFVSLSFVNCAPSFITLVFGGPFRFSNPPTVERGGAPKVAPPGGEDLSAGAVGGGEEVDDVAQDAVKEAAEAVGGSLAVEIF